jgi:hypothetical protein
MTELSQIREIADALRHWETVRIGDADAERRLRAAVGGPNTWTTAGVSVAARRLLADWLLENPDRLGDSVEPPAGGSYVSCEHSSLVYWGELSEPCPECGRDAMVPVVVLRKA